MSMVIEGVNLDNVLSASERVTKEREISHYENMIALARSPEGTELQIKKIPEYEKKMAILKERFARYNVKLNGKQKDALDKRRQELETILKTNLLSMGEMMRGSHIDVRNEIAFQEKYGRVAEEWQKICRALKPNEQEYSMIDRLRPAHISGSQV